MLTREEEKKFQWHFISPEFFNLSLLILITEGSLYIDFVEDVRSDGEKMTKNRKIKPQKTRGFNVENSSNAKGKNHGRQPARTSLYRVFVYND